MHKARRSVCVVFDPRTGKSLEESRGTEREQWSHEKVLLIKMLIRARGYIIGVR
jgi:hypothetical protein